MWGRQGPCRPHITLKIIDGTGPGMCEGCCSSGVFQTVEPPPALGLFLPPPGLILPPGLSPPGLLLPPGLSPSDQPPGIFIVHPSQPSGPHVERQPLPAGLSLGFPPSTAAASAPTIRAPTTLVIRNLPTFVDTAALVQLTLIAQPDFCVVVRDLVTFTSLGYGFVNCRTSELAASALHLLHGNFGLNVTWALSQGFMECWRQHVRSRQGLRDPLLQPWVAPCHQHVVDTLLDGRIERRRSRRGL